MHTSARSAFLHCLETTSPTSRTAVYGPVRTVVWQGSAGDCRPYADQTILRSVVPGQLPDPARRGGRPQAPRRRDRLPLHPAYLELQPAGSLSHPLRRSRRPIISRSSALDPDQSPAVPVAYSNLTHRVSREVPPGTPPALPQGPARLPRSCRRFQRPRVVPGTDEEAGRKEVVRLCQAPLRRPLPCPALSRPLYPSHGHQQPSPDGLRWTTRQLPLAGLCPRQQAAHHDPRRPGVPAPLLPARAAQRLRAHPPLRPALQPLSQTAAAPGAHLARDPEPPATSSAPAAGLRSLALSPLRKSHARRPALYRCSVISGSLRFFMTAGTNPLSRLAPRT